MRHIHFGVVKENYCQWLLKECRCGMRKTVFMGRRGGYSTLERGWPKPEEGWK